MVLVNVMTLVPAFQNRKMHANLIIKKQSSRTIKMSDKHIQSSHSSSIFFCLEKKDRAKMKKNWHYAQAGKASNIKYDNTRKNRKDPQKINVRASLEKHQYEHISIKGYKKKLLTKQPP